MDQRGYVLGKALESNRSPNRIKPTVEITGIWPPVGFSGDDKYEEREWGSFQILLDEPKVKVKKITVKPDQRLSLQLHRKREELWYVISGFGEMQVGSKVFDIESGRVIKINKYEVHRVKCAGLNDLVLVEIQTGICQEDDIVRIEDDYGRE